MRTYWCFDVSGSMDSGMLKRAIDVAIRRAQPGDFIFQFDAAAYGPYPVTQDIDVESSIRWAMRENLGRGGTYIKPLQDAIMSHAEGVEHRKVALSDGIMASEDLAWFDELVKIDHIPNECLDL